MRTALDIATAILPDYGAKKDDEEKPEVPDVLEDFRLVTPLVYESSTLNGVMGVRAIYLRDGSFFGCCAAQCRRKTFL